MSRTFAYCRVSTIDQTTDNQVGEIKRAGFAIDARRIVQENVSGSVAASQRAGFAKLLDRMESGDVLVVTKLDRLGRNAMDIRATVDLLASKGIKVHCLQLGGADLTSSAGKAVMGFMATMAEFERDLIIERTTAGIERARSNGVRFGRPPALTDAQRTAVLVALSAGDSVSKVAANFSTSRMTIMRVRDHQIS